VPYIAEDGDVLGRPAGQPLSVFGTVPSVEKGEISAYGFSALYQQRPTPSAGGVFKAEWMQRRYTSADLSRIIEEKKSGRGRWRLVQTVDLGGKQGVGHDPSAIATWGYDGISFYLLDYWASHAEYADIKAAFVSKWWEWQPRIMVVEDATWAQPLISDLRRESGINVMAKRAEGSKWTRADAISPLFQSGRIVLPESAPWLDAWMHEHLAFPNAAHDEAVDTTSMALPELNAIGVTMPKATITGKQMARWAV
jgi:predicted phage terminase large subunit-like protein